MEKFGKFIIFFVSCVFFSLSIYNLYVDKLFPKGDYSNNISFKLAFLNYDDVFKIVYKENSLSSEFGLKTIEVGKTNYLKDYSFSLPYQYDSLLYFGFGEAYPVSFAISNIIVNGKIVDDIKIIKSLEKIGYKVVYNNPIIYASYIDGKTNGKLNIYDLSDSFINLSNEEVDNFKRQEYRIRVCFYLSLLLLAGYCIFKISRLFKQQFMIKFLVWYSVFIYISLFVSSYIIIYKLSSLSVYDIILFLKNYSLIILLPILLFGGVAKTNKYIKSFICILSVVFLFLIGIDHFVQDVFGTRFLFGFIETFGKNLKDGYPFLVGYILDFSGLYYILSILSLIGLYFIYWQKEESFNLKKYCAVCIPILLFSVLGMFIGNNRENNLYFNVFQVNVNGIFSEGDYSRPYVKYKPYSIEQLEYTKKNGLNLRKNVIVVMVESLGCNVTFLCGNEQNLSPYTEELAKNNIWFPNYYSNAYHTNGAIFAVTTGYPFVASLNSKETPFSKIFYQYDLINTFKNNGYETAYFSPATMVLGKDKQLSMSQYEYLSFNTDEFYQDCTKNGVFNSVSDEMLFKKIIYNVQLTKKPIFYMTTTISTHTPYLVPWGRNRIDKAYAYSDMALKKFIKNLEKINYFDNGIVIVTGDHVGWSKNRSLSNGTLSKFESNRIPLIVIDGENHGVVYDDVVFSHTSLGVLLEYLMLPEYSQNKFQINPIVDHNLSEYIIHYDIAQSNIVDVKLGNKEDQILLDGDRSRFLGKSFTKREQDLFLGYLSWVRR